MKKLNKNGFTLIELLAIIVILAIIMVVTIPTVLGNLSEMKIKTFQNSVNTVADWVEKQYGLAVLEDPKRSSDFELLCNSSNQYCKNIPDCNGYKCGYNELGSNHDFFSINEVVGSPGDSGYRFLQSAGVKAENYFRVQIVVNSNNRACVKLFVRPADDGDFSDVSLPTSSPYYITLYQVNYGVYAEQRTWYSNIGWADYVMDGYFDDGDLIYMQSSGCE